MGTKDQQSPRLPSTPTVKLSKKLFTDLWWIARIEDKSPADLIDEVAGDELAVRRKRHEAAIARLIKLDAEQEQVKAESRQKSAGSR